MSVSFWAREDQKHGNDKYVDLTKDDAVEITFVKDGPDGDLVLEDNGNEPDPDTKAMIDGQTYDFVFEMTGELDDGKNVPDEFDDAQVAMITIIDYPEPGDETRFMFLPEADASEDDMNEFGDKKFKLDDYDRSPDDIALPVCFVAGTLIDTPDGPRPVQTLRAGDQVTLENGRVAKLLWATESHYSYAQLLQRTELRPVRIAADSLAADVPSQDLWVSQQHRIGLQGWQVEVLAAAPAAFAHAKHLAPVPGIPGPEWREGVRYVHLMCDRHQVLVANGTPAESLFLGDQALETLDEVARTELETLLAEKPWVIKKFSRTVMPTLKAHEAQTWRKMMSGRPVFRDLVQMAA
ncbi:hypothetical protein NBRC116594_32450 [Shimia sp. NS0008-38b]|uniref:Hint domain-containing protein n=1 Tax=Shimia sp. NS0008-38b TaxID=3127653 RepID=UPI0031033C21